MNTSLCRSVCLSLALTALTPVATAQDVKPDQPQHAPKPSPNELIEKLGDRNYQVRKSAEAALRGRGQEVIESLRKAAAEHGDAEVQWRARRLMQQIESGQDGKLQRRGNSEPIVPSNPGDPGTVGRAPMPWQAFGFQRDGNLQQMFGDVFEQLERDFGVDVPRTHFFRDDFFQGLQQQMEETRRGMAMGMPGRGQAFSMRMDQNGVRVEITEKGEDGKSDTKAYEAPDVQTFREQHPDIADRYLRDQGVRTFSFGNRAFPDARAFGLTPFRFDSSPQMQDAAVVDNGERLGVLVEDVPEPVRDFLGLAPGVGLRVQSVNEGSLAATLGVEAGDIVLQVGDKEVQGTQDVRDGLAGVPVGGSVSVKVNRRGADKTLAAKKPDGKASGTKLEKRADAGKTEIR